MANAQMIIYFADKVYPGENIDIQYKLGDGTSRAMYEVWVSGPRQAAFQVSEGQSPYLGIIAATEAATNFANSMSLDYSNIVDVARSNADVTLTMKSDAYSFTWLLTDIVSVDFEIVEATTSPIKVIQEVVSEAVVEPCSYLNLLVETDVLAVRYYSYGTWKDNTENPFNTSLYRGTRSTVTVENADGSTAVLNNGQPFDYDKLSVDNIGINVSVNITGATVTVEATNVIGLELEYSLDGSNWTSSNVFTGQPEGAGLMWVRDQFGCEVAKDYVVTALGTRSPFLYISEANSLNFILQENINECEGVYSNVTNTFASKNNVLLPSCTETLISKCDPKITSQLKSNFENINVTLRSEVGVETEVPVVKMSGNINRFQSMDCTIYNYGENQMGVFFTSGNTYAEDGQINGSYALNGNLPDFAVLGNYITINGNTYQIKSILYDDRSYIQKRVIVLEAFYSGDIASAIIDCYYDVLPYEVYQFDIDFSLLDVGLYDVKVVNSSESMDDIIYLTENINVADNHEDTLPIVYYNANNRDIFYKWKIENFIRVPYLGKSAVPKSESEISLGDNGAYVVDSRIYKSYEIKFGDHVESIMRKIEIATGCEFVFIAGEGFVGDDALEYERVGETNLYTISKTMVQSGTNYSTRDTGDSGVDADYTNFNIPPFVTDGIGFIKQ